MSKSVLGEVAEFFLTGFGTLDFLTKTSGKGQYKPKANIRSSGNSYTPRSRSFSSGSTGSSTKPKQKKKNELNAFTLEGLKIMNVNAVKIRTNYSGLKSGYKPKKKIDFSGLK